MRAHTKVDNDSLTSDSEIGTGDEKALERILERYSAAHGLASIGELHNLRGRNPN